MDGVTTLDITRTPTVTVAPAPPVGPLVGDLWWNTTNGRFFIWYDDGNTVQWVSTQPMNMIDIGMPTGDAGGDLAGFYPNPLVKTDVVLNRPHTLYDPPLSDSSDLLASTRWLNAKLVPASGDFTFFGGKPTPPEDLGDPTKWIDNHDAFMAAFDAAYLRGGMTLYLPAGTYYTSPVPYDFNKKMPDGSSPGTGITVIGDGKMSTRLSAIAKQQYIWRLWGDIQVKDFEVSGWNKNSEEENYPDYGIIFENGTNSIQGCRFYRTGTGAWVKQGNNLYVQDNQFGLFLNHGLLLGGTDNGANPVVGALREQITSGPDTGKWKLTITTSADPHVKVSTADAGFDMFVLYNFQNASWNFNKYKAVTGTDADTNTAVAIVASDPGNPGPLSFFSGGELVLSGWVNTDGETVYATFTPWRGAGASISETKIEALEAYAGAYSTSVTDGAYNDPNDPDAPVVPPLPLVPILPTWEGDVLVIPLAKTGRFRVDDRVVLRDWLPASVNGISFCEPGTAGDIVKVKDLLGVASGTPVTWATATPATVGASFGGSGLTLGTDNGATRVVNSEFGSCNISMDLVDNVGQKYFPGDGEGFGPYRGSGFTHLDGVNMGVAGVYGCAIQVNGAGFVATGQTSFAAPNAGGIGLFINSPVAAPRLEGVEAHWCGVAGIYVKKHFSLTMDGYMVRKIGEFSGDPTHGAGIVFAGGDGYATIQNPLIDPDLTVETGQIMDYGIVLQTPFAGRVDVLNPLIRNCAIAETANLSAAGTLVVDYGTYHVPTGITPTAFAARAAQSHIKQLVLSAPLTTVWAETLDLTGLNGKTFISQYGGDHRSSDVPLIRSTASPTVVYDGRAMNFEGTWWFKSGLGAPDPNQVCIRFSPGVTDTHWGRLIVEDYGVCRQAINGDIHGVHTDFFEPVNCLTFGFQAYAWDDSTSVQYIHDDWVDAQTSTDGFVLYSLGPGVGSNGSQGLQADGGILYGGRHALHTWAAREIYNVDYSGTTIHFYTRQPHGLLPGDKFTTTSFVGTPAAAQQIVSQSYDAATQILTYVTTGAHSYVVGDQVIVEGSNGTGANASRYSGTFVALAGTIGATIKCALPSTLNPGDGNPPAVGAVLGHIGSYNATGLIAIGGTGGTDIRATMKANPGALVTLGYFGPAAFAGGVWNQFPRSVHVTNFQRRAGIGDSYLLDAGHNVSLKNAKSDGTTYNMTNVVSGSWSAAGGGVATWNTAIRHGNRVGDKFRIFRGISPASAPASPTGDGWVGEFTAITGTTETVLKAAVAADPGGLPTNLATPHVWHGVYLGPGYSGSVGIHNSQMSDHHGAGLYSRGVLAMGIEITASNFNNNSSANDPNWGNSYNLWSGLEFDPSSQRVALRSVNSGSNETFRHNSSLMTFISNPADGHVLTLNGIAYTFKDTPNSGMNLVQRGADVATSLANWIDYVRKDLRLVRIVPVQESALVWRLYQATGGVSMPAFPCVSSAPAAISFSTSPLSGGTGTSNQKAGVTGIADAYRDCLIDRTSNFRNNAVEFGTASQAPIYEDKQWVPGFTFTTPGTLTHPLPTGISSYQRWGNWVQLQLSTSFTPTFGVTPPTGEFIITGLPYPAFGESAGQLSSSDANMTTWPAGTVDLALVTVNGTTTMKIASLKPGSNTAMMTVASFPTGAGATTYTFRGTIRYRIGA